MFVDIRPGFRLPGDDVAGVAALRGGQHLPRGIAGMPIEQQVLFGILVVQKQHRQAPGRIAESADKSVLPGDGFRRRHPAVDAAVGTAADLNPAEIAALAGVNIEDLEPGDRLCRLAVRPGCQRGAGVGDDALIQRRLVRQQQRPRRSAARRPRVCARAATGRAKAPAITARRGIRALMARTLSVSKERTCCRDQPVVAGRSEAPTGHRTPTCRRHSRPADNECCLPCIGLDLRRMRDARVVKTAQAAAAGA